MTVLLSLMLTFGIPGQPPQPAPPRPGPAKPTPTKQAIPAPVPAPAPSPLEVCDYITPDEARGLLGADVTPTTAPSHPSAHSPRAGGPGSKGGLTSCGYTSPNGDAITLSIADYGIPLVAQQFFDQTRKALKTTTTNDETLGVPAFSYTIFAGPVPTPPAPAAPAGAKPPTTPAPAPPPAPYNTPPGISLVALKDQRIVTLGAVGLTAGGFDNLPKLRAIVTRVLATLTPPAAGEAAPR